MKKTILFFVLLLSTNFLFAQGSITFPSDPVDDNGIVDFTFNLDGGGELYDLSVEVSFDGGSVTPTFHLVSPEDIISGTLKNVEPGSDISLQWDAMASFSGQVTSEALLRVIARHVCGTNFTFNYRGSSVTYGTVSKTYNEGTEDELTLCWLDRNLGADKVAQSSDDADAYGDLFQWGRLDDGHQDRASTTTSTLSPTNDPGHGSFIKPTSLPRDWLAEQNNDLWQGEDGINNPCPSGWRVPTKAELEKEMDSWDTANPAGAFGSDLKWPVSGYRDHSSGIMLEGENGLVWSSSISSEKAYCLSFSTVDVDMVDRYRADGNSLRCVRD